MQAETLANSVSGVLGFMSKSGYQAHWGLWKVFCSHGSGLLPVVAGRNLFNLHPHGECQYVSVLACQASFLLCLLDSNVELSACLRTDLQLSLLLALKFAGQQFAARLRSYLYESLT